MNTAWAKIPVGEVVSLVERAEVPIPGKYYRQIGVRLWGQGAYEREILDGGQTRYQELYRVETSDIIVNKIWARNGSVAVVNGELAGCFCSGEFPIYAPDRNRIEPRWFHWITKTSWFWYACDLKSRGTSGKNRIRPEKFLEIQIPLPPLDEQRRIVAKIDELSARILDARTLSQQATEEAEAMLNSWLNSTFSHIGPKTVHPLGEVTQIIGGGSLPGLILAEDSAREVFFVKVSDMNRPGNEVFIRESAMGVAASSPLLKRVRVLPPNTIVFPKRGGAIATNKKRLLQRPSVLDPNMMGVFSKDEQNLSPEYLFAWLKNLDLAAMQGGTSVPQINKGDFAPLLIPIPLLSEQRRIVAELDAFQAEVDELKRLQAETVGKLDALLPSILDKAFKGEL